MSVFNVWPGHARKATVLALAGAIWLPLVVDAAAQNSPAVPKDKQDRLPAPPGNKGDKGDKGDKPPQRRPPPRAAGASIPDDPAKRALLLRDLYALLATAEDQDSATVIAGSIERVWSAGAGDTVHVLMERAVKSQAEERPDLALRMLDTITRIAPDYAEGFNRRAYVYYALNEFERALGDLRRVLALDPNHYKALEGLGQILRETGQKKGALEVYRKLLAVHPFASGVKSTVEELERSVVGQGS